MLEFQEGCVVSVFASLANYGVELLENGVVIEVYPEGVDGFEEPCAKVMFEGAILKFGTNTVTKTISPFIKIKDLVFVSFKGKVKNIRIPDIKFDVKTKYNICNKSRDSAIALALAVKNIDKIDAGVMEKLDVLFKVTGDASSFGITLRDRKKKLKRKLKENLTNLSSSTKTVTAYRNIRGTRFDLDLPFNKTSLKADLKKVKKQLDIVVKNHRRALKDSLVTTTDMMGVPITKSGNVFDKGGQILLLQNQVPKIRIMQPKKPLLNDEYVGIEIECITDLDSYEPLRKSFIKDKLDKYVDVVSDGSLRNNDGESGERRGCVEVRVLCRNSEKEDVLKRVMKVLDSHDGHVNSSCGTHVHFDMRKIDAKVAFNNLVKIQSILKNAQPESRRNHEYCKANSSADIDSYPTGDRHSRYWYINPHSLVKHNTIEVRLHEGTLDADGLCSWIDLIFAVAKAPKFEKTFLKINTLNNVVELTPESVEYIAERTSMYA